MDTPSDAQPRRNSSQTSAHSSRKSSTARIKPRKHASNTSLQHGITPSDKSFTSFPSLSPPPDVSPKASRSEVLKANLTDGQLGNAVGLPALPVDRKIPRTTQSLVGSLVTFSPSTRNRSALFDDTPQDVRDVPGNIHLASDEHIQHVIERRGAIAMVRQLAEDLAQRDAQMTVLRRKAEERERILRKMLRECEVSNLDIENRLRELERSSQNQAGGTGAGSRKKMSNEDTSLHFEASMSDRLAQSLSDSRGNNVTEEYGLVSSDVRQLDGMLLEDNSVSSFDFPVTEDSGVEIDPSHTSRPRSTTKGWKGIFWNGNATARKTSNPVNTRNNQRNNTEVHSRPRSSTDAKALRKPLNSNLFQPPPADMRRSVSGTSQLHRVQSEPVEEPESHSRGSSISVTSWALKLVAGNNQITREQGTARGRTAAGGGTVSAGPRTPSTSSTQASRTVGKAASSGAVGRTNRGRPARSSLGPNGTIKSISPESFRRSTISLAPTSPHEEVNQGMGTLGPVEMDTILPEESRPPTLLQHHNNWGGSVEFLTDRFGFIYDQRRRKRQAEAATAAALRKEKRSSHVESLNDARDILEVNSDSHNETASLTTGDDARPASKPGSVLSADTQDGPQPSSRWQDFLKLATFPTELLSHTPSTVPITTVESVEVEPPSKPSQLLVQKRGSLPALSVNPEPAPSKIFAGNAEIAQPSASGTTSPINMVDKQPDPVKALLDQLTELHDSLQREKTVTWNDFMRKVRAERQREGEAAPRADGRSNQSAMPETFLADGELIGVAGLGNKGKIGRAKWKEFKHLVLGGIPVAYRPKIWAECSGANALRIPGYYEDLVKDGHGDPEIVNQIQMDITRTLTDNIYFRRGVGVHRLNEVLLAYSRRNPEVGYCQGMNLITACLLLIMPTAEDAFWMLATMVENILPPKYYDHDLLTSRADQVVLRQYVAELLPKLSTHLQDLSIELEALTFQWFLSVFTDCLSAEALYRVWDVVLCMHDGSTFLFQVALALLKLNERNLLECDNPASVYHYINHQMTNHAISIDALIQASEALKKFVKKPDVEQRRQKAVDDEKELMRQREEARRVRTAAAARRKAGLEDGSSEEQGGNGAVAAVADHRDSASELSREEDGRSPAGWLSLASREEEELEDALAEMQVRTPMPIDEEALWRA